MIKAKISFLLSVFLLVACNAANPPITVPPVVSPFVPVGTVENRELAPTTERVKNCGGGSGTIVKHPAITVLSSHTVEWQVGQQTGVGVTIGDGVVPGGVNLQEVLDSHITSGSQTGIEQSTAWDLPAQPNTIMEYTLAWREIWQPGYVEVKLADHSVVQIKVAYRTGIQSDITDQRLLPCDTAQPSDNKYTQSFDKDGGYDTNAWVCANGDCNTQDVFQQNGMLVFKLNASNPTYSYLKSQTAWKTTSLVSLQGKLQIGVNTGGGGVWLGIDGGSLCSISKNPDTTPPYFHCDIGPNSNKDYVTADMPVKMDNWYSMRIDIDPVTNENLYYLDDKLIGRYTPKSSPDYSPLSIGAWITDNRSVEAYMDEVVVRTGP